ncbi:hypothetical protein [Mucilaginibacter defluvii]
MQTLENLDNHAKAKLFHQLFKNEIPNIIQYVENIADSLSEDQAKYREAWKGSFFTFDSWLNIAQEIKKSIEKHREELYRNSTAFADNLFDFYNGAFMIQYMNHYITTRKEPNIKLVQAIQLFFDN